MKTKTLNFNIMKTKTLLLLAFVSLFPNMLFSQEKGMIIYTDFEPDSIYAFAGYGQIVFDINYDSTPDFRFVKEGNSGGDMDYIKVYVNWKLGFCEDDSDTVSLCTKWYDYCQLWDYEYEGDHIDCNLALRHWVPGEGLYYGWLKAKYQFDNEIKEYTITLYDMAYCTIPNYPLRFGQKDFVDIEENEYAAANVKLFPNPVEDRLSLQLSGNASCESVEIYGIDGRLLKSQNDDFENIDVSSLSRGLYIAKINLSDGNVYTDKIVVR